MKKTESNKTNLDSNQNYYLGLDIGTNSVGWAVTDEKYNLVSYKKKDMWGSRCFDSANTAKDRRLYRNARRRLNRKKLRIHYLNTIFESEISKFDPDFLVRIRGNDLNKSLFIDPDYTDKNYFKDFPTVFHLRKALIEDNELLHLNDDKRYSRYLYLAIHSLLKSRGHFLLDDKFKINDGDVDFSKGIAHAFIDAYNAFADLLNESFNFSDVDKCSINTIFNSKNTNKNKSKELLNVFGVTKPEYKKAIKSFCNGCVGENIVLNDLFECDEYIRDDEPIKFNFKEEKYETVIYPDLLLNAPDRASVINLMKITFDMLILYGIMDGKKYISEVRVNQYDIHRKNLKELKRLFNEYSSEQYYKLFDGNTERKSKNNGIYSAYIGSVESKGKKYRIKKVAQINDFYIKLRKELEDLNKKDVKETDRTIIQEMIEHCKGDCQDLLPLQRTKFNGIIPQQVNFYELEKILDNAKKYLTYFLNEPDKDGLNNTDKIKSIFSFRIPYYIGPIGGKTKEQKKWAWVERKNSNDNSYIYPWNFNEKIDMLKTHDAFIERLKNDCTYLIGEEVLPKDSLLYSKFMILDRLNKLKIRQKPIDVKTKQRIFNELFKKEKKVTINGILGFLKKDDNKLGLDDISFSDDDLIPSYKSYISFSKIFGGYIDDSNRGLVDKIDECIKDICIFKDDRKALYERLKNRLKNDLDFSDEKIKKIANELSYNGWGKFSKKLLTRIKANVENFGNISIIEAMWETNNNFMQLLGNKFDYSDKIHEENKNKLCNPSFTYNDIVLPLHTSPANKRAIWQALKIVKEIEKIIGYPPRKIFIEVARGEGKKIKTDKRKEKLLDLYKNIDKELSQYYDKRIFEELQNIDNKKLSSKRVFLYFIQLGKCMYTLQDIQVDDYSKWDRDHIIPQTYIKNDSIDNLALVDINKNRDKGKQPLPREIQDKCEKFWRLLFKNNLISKEKLNNLLRIGEEFTDEELSGFLNSQIVETRQSSKLVYQLLQDLYPHSKVACVKAGLVSGFRDNNLCGGNQTNAKSNSMDTVFLKSRNINKFHHAKDAYLNIVIGNVYNSKYNEKFYYKKNENENHLIKDKIRKEIIDEYRKNGIKNIFNHTVKNKDNECIWIVEKDNNSIGTVKKFMKRDTPQYTEMCYTAKGELFNVTPKARSANEDQEEKKIRLNLKKNLPIEKYGYYDGIKFAYYLLIESTGQDGSVKTHLVGIPIYVDNICRLNVNKKEEIIDQYLVDIGQKEENDKKFKKIRKIKINSLFVYNGFPLRLRGSNIVNFDFNNNLQLKLKDEFYITACRIERFLEKYKSQIKEYESLVNEIKKPKKKDDKNKSDIEKEEIEKKIEEKKIERDQIKDWLNAKITKLLSEDDMGKLYDEYINKLESIYKNRPANKAKELKKKRKVFEELLPFEKAEALNKILNLFVTGTKAIADLSLLTLGKSKGSISIKKTTFESACLTLVTESVTGLIKNKINLIKKIPKKGAK